MTGINPTGQTSSYSTQQDGSDVQKRIEDKSMELGADTFLQLLVTQMRYQDPFSGGEDMGDFMSQISQFTMLERLVNIQNSLEDLAEQQAPLQALDFLNKVVEIETDGGTLRGEVTSVRFKEGISLLKVDGEEYPLKDVALVEGK